MIAEAKPDAIANVAKHFEGARADYRMSKESRFVRRRVGLPSQGSGADWHYRNEWSYYNDIEKARDMDRNDAIVGQTIDRAVANVIQDGFTLDVNTGSPALNDDLHAMWRDWATDPDACDIEGESTWHDFEQQSCRAMMVDGDCVNVGLDSGHLQHLEAHSIQTKTRTANTVLGVEKNESGRRVAYHVMQDPIESYKQTQRTDSVPLAVRNDDGLRLLFHVYNPRRKSQTRGVTVFAPIFEVAGMFEDTMFAKLVQEQMVSCFTIFRKRGFAPPHAGGNAGTAAGYGNSSTETTSNGTRFTENIVPGMEVIGEPGEELQGFSPNVPGTGYFDHVRLKLQLIGVNLGMPLCLVLLDGAESTFHGYRGAIHEARKGFKRIQRNLVNRMHTPTYRFKVAQFMASSRSLRVASRDPGININGHSWNLPAFTYIDPKTDAEADALLLQNGLTSPRRLHAERSGAEWSDIYAESIEDNAGAITAAQAKASEINAKAGKTIVQWRDLISIPMPNGVQQTLQDPVVTEAAESEAVTK